MVTATKTVRKKSKSRNKNARIIVGLITALAIILAPVITGIFGWFAATANWEKKQKKTIGLQRRIGFNLQERTAGYSRVSVGVLGKASQEKERMRMVNLLA